MVAIPSGFDHLAERYADEVIDTGQLTEVELAVLQSTAVQTWSPRLFDGIWLGAVRDRTVDQLSALRMQATLGGPPRAVVAHLPLPHIPYVLNSDCSERLRDRFTFQAIDPDGPDVPEAMAVAGGQTACVDRLLTDALKDVVASDPTGVVIVMSDHGPDVRFDWDAPGGIGLRDRSSNFFAARTPDRSAVFPDDITVVNVLPIFFNAYFDAGIPLSANDVYDQPERDGRLVVAPIP